MPLAGLKALSAELVAAKWIGTKKGSDLMANQMNALGLRYETNLVLDGPKLDRTS